MSKEQNNFLLSEKQAWEEADQLYAKLNGLRDRLRGLLKQLQIEYADQWMQQQEREKLLKRKAKIKKEKFIKPTKLKKTSKVRKKYLVRMKKQSLKHYNFLQQQIDFPSGSEKTFDEKLILKSINDFSFLKKPVEIKPEDQKSLYCLNLRLFIKNQKSKIITKIHRCQCCEEQFDQSSILDEHIAKNHPQHIRVYIPQLFLEQNQKLNKSHEKQIKQIFRVNFIQQKAIQQVSIIMVCIKTLQKYDILVFFLTLFKGILNTVFN